MIEIPSHSQVFLDTNILLYAVTDHPRFGQWCNTLLDRIHRGDVIGYISVVVLNEFIHKSKVSMSGSLRKALSYLTSSAISIPYKQLLSAPSIV